jgi:hypothetical protein
VGAYLMAPLLVLKLTFFLFAARRSSWPGRRLPADAGKGGFRMYCAKCHRQLYYSDPEKHGWCFDCNRVVDIDQCKIPFWSLMAVFTTAWPLCL